MAAPVRVRGLPEQEEVPFPNTTDVDELVAWVCPFDHVAVFATYGSLGLGTLERTHQAGPPRPGPDRRGRGTPHVRPDRQAVGGEREGHLTVPRKHVETITIGGDSEDQAQQDVSLKVGTWIDNQRRRAATLTPERVDQLSKVGMRWA